MSETQRMVAELLCDQVLCIEQRCLLFRMSKKRGRGMLLVEVIVEETLLHCRSIEPAHTYSHQAQQYSWAPYFIEHVIELGKPGKLIGTKVGDLSLAGMDLQVLVAYF